MVDKDKVNNNGADCEMYSILISTPCRNVNKRCKVCYIVISGPAMPLS